MSSKLLYILQILLLNTIFISTSNYQCVDCNGDGKRECTDKGIDESCLIDTKSGYSCGQYRYKDLNIRASDWSSPNPTDDLELCIPEDLNITEPNIEICCVWSRSLGCQIIVKPGNEYTCGICRNYDRQSIKYSGLSPCPCSRVSPKLHNHVVCGIFIVLQLVFKLYWDFRLNLGF